MIEVGWYYAMGKFIDLTGQKINHWTVIRRAENHIQPNGKSTVMWECQCDCERKTIAIVRGDTLKLGQSTQCIYCARTIAAKEASKVLSIHKERYTRLYGIWAGMKNRCNNPNVPSYADYGGRGIIVCDEWKDSYETFRDWANANGYIDSLTIDRIDVDGDYEPSNCRWVTPKEQSNNRRSNKLITFNGETHNIHEWSEIIGINYHTLYNRLYKLHWSVEKALATLERTK